MEPQNFTFAGFVILIAGFTLALFGSLLLGQAYFCTINYSATRPLNATDAANRIGYSIPLVVFGSLMVLPGAIFIASGHITEKLGRAGVSEKESNEESAKS